MGSQKRFSDCFCLDKCQAELDFVDVPLNTDLMLFCDPFAFLVEQSPWYQECEVLIRDFFSRLIQYIHDDKKTEAMRLLAHVGEVNEVHLGFSSGASAGLGIGRQKAEQLYEQLTISRAVKTGKLYDLAECDLFIPGIGPDNISDMTINLIRSKLLEYTAQQCQQLGISVSKVQGGFCWDSHTEAWVNRYAELPVFQDKQIILVPKAAVRYRLAMEYHEYYSKFVLEFLQAENLRADTSLVELLKNGRRRVTKKSLQKKHPLTKDFLFQFSEDNPQVLQDYKEHARTQSSFLTDEELERAQHASRLLDIDSIIGKLREIQSGPNDAFPYSKVIQGALEAIFYPQLYNFKAEQREYEGRKRIDIVANNTMSGGFFSELNTLHHIHCPYILIECKNYAEDIANRDFDQLTGRFDKAISNFGILVCRHIKDKTKMLQSAKDILRSGRGHILVLEDSDIIEMLQNRKAGDYSAISSYMGNKLREICFAN